jgi:FkbM family methyltransferase
MSLPFVAGRWLLRIRPAPLASALKRLLRVRRLVLPTVQGRFWVDPASVLGAALGREGVFEPITLNILSRLLHPGDTFLDVGANEGYFAVVAARRVGPSGRVIAVEPQQRLQEVLRRNFDLNECRQVAIVAAAVSDRPGVVRLHLAPDMNNGASSLAPATRYRLPTESVAGMTLAELLTNSCIPDGVVVKMDIESWEYEAILGSAEIFRAGRIRALILELHHSLLFRRQRDPTVLERFLTECGYQRLAESEGRAWICPAASPGITVPDRPGRSQ